MLVGCQAITHLGLGFLYAAENPRSPLHVEQSAVGCKLVGLMARKNIFKSLKIVYSARAQEPLYECCDNGQKHRAQLHGRLPNAGRMQGP